MKKIYQIADSKHRSVESFEDLALVHGDRAKNIFEMMDDRGERIYESCDVIYSIIEVR